MWFGLAMRVVRGKNVSGSRGAWSASEPGYRVASRPRQKWALPSMEIRVERARRLMLRWGGVLGAVLLAGLLGAGGWQGWRWWQAHCLR